jgi:PAS domain S-box-containing protein
MNTSNDLMDYLDTLNEGVCEFSADGTIFLSNQAFPKLIGYTVKEVMSPIFNWKLVTHPDDVLNDELQIRKVLKYNNNVKYEKRFIHRNGSIVYVTTSYKQLKIQHDPNCIHMVAVITDITVLKKKDEQLISMYNEQHEVLESINERLKLLAKGDIKSPISNFNGKWKSLSDNLTSVINTFSNLANTAKEMSSHLKISLYELESETIEINKKSQVQASSTEEISSSMEELNTSFSEIINKIDEGSKLLNLILKRIIEGSKDLVKLNDIMSTINNSGESINNFASLINEISVKTNIIAINALIEAAHYDSQSNGFTVIANEIRNLSNLTALNSKEIKKSVDEIIMNFVNGINLSNEVLELFNRITIKTDTCNNIFDFINQSIKQQENNTEYVNTSLQEIAKITQFNSVLVEELNNTISIIKEKSNKLDELLQSLKT